jgi:RNase H-fold protein (predicted Holliday junction resolvase)
VSRSGRIFHFLLSRRAPLWSTLLLGVALLFGCEGKAADLYRTSGVYPEGVQSVGVAIFRNATFERGIERRLTDAVIKEIRVRTPYRLVAVPTADTVVRGVITDVERVKLSTDRATGLTQELGLRITVNFEWVDERSGEVLAARRSFSAGDVIVPASPVGEPIESGIDQAVQELAQGVVDAMRSDW